MEAEDHCSPYIDCHCSVLHVLPTTAILCPVFTSLISESSQMAIRSVECSFTVCRKEKKQNIYRKFGKIILGGTLNLSNLKIWGKINISKSSKIAINAQKTKMIVLHIILLTLA